MSGSGCTSVKDPTEERFPLLLQLLEEEKPSEPDSSEESSRSKRVHNGVAMLLGRWPGYITTGCISAAFLSMVTIFTIVMIMTILIVTTLDSNMAHELVTRRESALLSIDTPCDYQEEQDKIIPKNRKRSNYNIFNFLSRHSVPVVKRDNSSVAHLPTSAPHKVFFVTSDDILSPRHLCAVESAAKVKSNYTCYLIILSSNNTKPSDKRFDELLNLYPNIKIFRLNGDKYFHDSPLRYIMHKSKFSPSLIVFAARILTLWRYGGITYDLDLVTLSNNFKTTYPVPNDDNVMISRDGGSVMSVRLQCHAFLYEIMTSLTSLYAQHESCDISNNYVIQYALKDFCYNASKKLKHTELFPEKSYKLCKGISAMPHYLICRNVEERMSPSNVCVWASCNGSSIHFRESLCPVSYRYASKETSQIKKMTTHKIRHKHSD